MTEAGCWRGLHVGLALLVMVSSPVAAQIGGGALAGSIVDQAGASVPGAAVTITAAGTNLSRTTVTSPEGSIRCRRTGPWHVQDARRAERISTTDARWHSLGHWRDGSARPATRAWCRGRSRHGHGGRATSSQRDLRARPCDRQQENRRSAAERPQLHYAGDPGTGRGGPSSAGRPFPRINGGRPRTNEYLFDGISVLQPEPGQVAFFPNVDAIQEFKIESNSPPAEFGRFNGGVVNLTTKSGGNAFRGSAFDVRPPRIIERPKLFCLDQCGQAAVPPQSVWWCLRWAPSP